ncbi:transglycosylase [Zafaria cholistanensis]|uniref:Transglycosylase n=1 Tax=Zafaria cholistanensis TaxID=1682741 RepID=A0A5A7NSC2_9MICC|nr:resuscitation-promoting factor [Zafaria cholistanensis]GER22698.1 transglycosylase [Zafaria cholistanensis]
MLHAFKNRWVKIGAQATVLTALVLGLVSFVGANKTIAVTVDGQTRSVQTFGSTVADVLAASDITVAPEDEVTPALEAGVSNGSSIEVNRSKQVSVSIDGVDRVVHTTGLTVADVLAQLEVAGGSEVSAAGQLELVSLKTPLEITTPKEVRIAVDGKDRKLSTTAATVADLLAEADITVGKEDELSAKTGDEVVDGLKLKVVRVETKTKTETESIAAGTTKVKDPKLAKGTTKVLSEGKDGERKLTYKVVVKDGKAVSTELVKTEVLTEAKDARIAVGTKQAASSSSGGGTTAGAGGVSGAWAALAKCESGGNWAINTGNGYYGGLQFSLSSWQGVGGTKYAPYPHQATPAEQVAAAEKLRANGGWGHWPSCSAKLGLR